MPLLFAEPRKLDRCSKFKTHERDAKSRRQRSVFRSTRSHAAFKRDIRDFLCSACRLTLSAFQIQPLGRLSKSCLRALRRGEAVPPHILRLCVEITRFIEYHNLAFWPIASAKEFILSFLNGIMSVGTTPKDALRLFVAKVYSHRKEYHEALLHIPQSTYNTASVNNHALLAQKFSIERCQELTDSPRDSGSSLRLAENALTACANDRVVPSCEFIRLFYQSLPVTSLSYMLASSEELLRFSRAPTILEIKIITLQKLLRCDEAVGVAYQRVTELADLGEEYAKLSPSNPFSLQILEIAYEFLPLTKKLKLVEQYLLHSPDCCKGWGVLQRALYSSPFVDGDSFANNATDNLKSNFNISKSTLHKFTDKAALASIILATPYFMPLLSDCLRFTFSLLQSKLCFLNYSGNKVEPSSTNSKRYLKLLEHRYQYNHSTEVTTSLHSLVDAVLFFIDKK